MKTKAVIFDMDGVITNTEKIHYLAWKKTFKEIGVDLTLESFYKHIQSRARNVSISNILDQVSEKNILSISNRKGVIYEQMIYSSKPEIYKDAIELIEFLSVKGIRMAVASASSFSKKMIRLINLEDKFEFIIDGTEVKKNKPNPEIYNMAIHKLGLHSRECIVIEDSLSGIEAGLKAYTRVIGIDRENHLNTTEGVFLTKSLSTEDVRKFIIKDDDFIMSKSVLSNEEQK